MVMKIKMERRNNSPLLVQIVGVVLLLVALLRLFGLTVPTLAVALISVIAALISLADLLELVKEDKKYADRTEKFALCLFGLSLLVWFSSYTYPLNFDWVPVVGDAATLLGLGLVIYIYGYRERKIQNNIKQEEAKKLEEKEQEKKKLEELKEAKWKVTLNEYEEMNNINRSIIQLQDIDEETLPLHKLHNGWATLSFSLTTYFNELEGPFFDGVNREVYREFLICLNDLSKNIDNIIDPDHPIYIANLKVGTEKIAISRYNMLRGRGYKPSDEQVNIILHKRKEVLSSWTKVKSLILKRYEKEEVKRT